MVEIENNNLSGFLSPINLGDSSRDISTKLDELYKSYESKEKIFGINNIPNNLKNKQDEEE
jgi:hypothetical protein